MKPLLKAFTAFLSLTALVALSATARSPYDQPAPRISPVTGRILDYNIPKVRTQRVGFEDINGEYANI